MFDLRITENSSELFEIEMKGELNATEAGDEQQAAAPFVATGLPAAFEEGFALEVAVELVGELDAKVLEYAVFHCVCCCLVVGEFFWSDCVADSGNCCTFATDNSADLSSVGV